VCISWTNKELNIINMRGATTKIIEACASQSWKLPDDGLCKPKHVGATIIILNDFSSLTIL